MQISPIVTSECLLSFRSRLIRDLAWAITLPPIVEPVWPPSSISIGTMTEEALIADWGTMGVPVVSNPEYWISRDRYERAWQRMEPILRRLDDDDEALPGTIPSPLEIRHGLRFEHLLAAWFDLDPEIHVLERDRQVFDGGKTIGQIDFIVEWEGAVVQLEVAVKFYLRFGSVNALSGYVGTDLRDRLDIKLAHMLFHQRRVSVPELPAGRRSAVSLRGVIYTPLPSRGAMPHQPEERDALPVASLPRYWWAYERDVDPRGGTDETTELLHSYRWAFATAERWFSPVYGDETTWMSWGEVLDAIAKRDDVGTPRAIMVIAGRGVPEPSEIARGILVSPAGFRGQRRI